MYGFFLISNDSDKEKAVIQSDVWSIDIVGTAPADADGNNRRPVREITESIDSVFGVKRRSKSGFSEIINADMEDWMVKSDMQIRKASEADLDCIEKLYEDICGYLETHKNYPGWKKGIYPIRCDAEKGLMENALYVARAGKRIVGTIMLKHEPEEGYKNGRWLTEDDYEHIYVVYTLAVHPDYLKCGIGTELLMFAEREAQKEQCVSIRLDVVKGNIPAERLYQKCGYQFAGTVSLGYEAYGLPWYNLYEKIILAETDPSER